MTELDYRLIESSFIDDRSRPITLNSIQRFAVSFIDSCVSSGLSAFVLAPAGSGMTTLAASLAAWYATKAASERIVATGEHLAERIASRARSICWSRQFRELALDFDHKNFRPTARSVFDLPRDSLAEADVTVFDSLATYDNSVTRAGFGMFLVDRLNLIWLPQTKSSIFLATGGHFGRSHVNEHVARLPGLAFAEIGVDNHFYAYQVVLGGAVPEGLRSCVSSIPLSRPRAWYLKQRHLSPHFDFMFRPKVW